MIQIDHIIKSYGNTRALHNISFRVEQGELFGLIGPDGAGKTTLFRMLTTLLLPDQGNATVAGWDIRKDFRKIRSRIGYMPGRFSLYQDLTVEENLEFFATMFATTIRKNYDFIRDIYVQIEPFKDRRAGALSGGMKQKLALCCALIHRPQVLFLDEPTTGVDPVSRKEFWDMLKDLKKSGITILVSTPFMDEAARCERMALLQKGKILAIDTPEGIQQGFSNPLWAVNTDAGIYQLLQDLNQYDRMHSAFTFGENVHYIDRQPAKVAESLQRYLEQRGHSGIHIRNTKASIEDRFMELMMKEDEL